MMSEQAFIPFDFESKGDNSPSYGVTTIRVRSYDESTLQ